MCSSGTRHDSSAVVSSENGSEAHSSVQCFLLSMLSAASACACAGKLSLALSLPCQMSDANTHHAMSSRIAVALQTRRTDGVVFEEQRQAPPEVLDQEEFHHVAPLEHVLRRHRLLPARGEASTACSPERHGLMI